MPGLGYTAQAPLLSLAAEALSDHDARVETIEWLIPDGFFAADSTEPFVRTYLAAALHRLGERAPGATPVVIAKSLGSYAATLVADRNLPAIWLTPLLTDDSIAAAITRSTAPALLIGGSADRSWSADAAAATSKAVVTVEGGDHSLRVPGRLRAYTDVLGDVGTAIEDFLTSLP